MLNNMINERARVLEWRHRMKLSKYNFFYRVEDGVLAFNARTNALAVIEDDNFEKVQKMAEG